MCYTACMQYDTQVSVNWRHQVHCTGGAALTTLCTYINTSTGTLNVFFCHYFKGQLKCLNKHCHNIRTYHWEDFCQWFDKHGTTVYRNNSSDLDIFAHWVPPYYAQSAFDLTSSCLLNVTFLFFLQIFFTNRHFCAKTSIWGHIIW